MVQIPSPQDAESLEIIEFQGFSISPRKPVKTHKQTHFTNFLPTRRGLPLYTRPLRGRFLFTMRRTSYNLPFHPLHYNLSYIYLKFFRFFREPVFL